MIFKAFTEHVWFIRWAGNNPGHIYSSRKNLELMPSSVQCLGIQIFSEISSMHQRFRTKNLYYIIFYLLLLFPILISILWEHSVVCFDRWWITWFVCFANTLRLIDINLTVIALSQTTVLELKAIHIFSSEETIKRHVKSSTRTSSFWSRKEEGTVVTVMCPMQPDNTALLTTMCYLKSHQITLHLSHGPNRGRPHCEMLTYKPLTNSAFQKELRKKMKKKDQKVTQ